MNTTTLDSFREIAATMLGRTDWQWIGPHASQRMFGISEERAKAYAARHGGAARQMVEYTADEMAAMVRGYSAAERIAISGGVFQCGNVPFPQAITAEHARKLWASNFGGDVPAVRLMNGNFVVAEY